MRSEQESQRHLVMGMWPIPLKPRPRSLNLLKHECYWELPTLPNYPKQERRCGTRTPGAAWPYHSLICCILTEILSPVPFDTFVSKENISVECGGVVANTAPPLTRHLGFESSAWDRPHLMFFLKASPDIVPHNVKRMRHPASSSTNSLPSWVISHMKLMKQR